MMNREQYVLASMSMAKNQALSPVQAQKFFFLLEKNASCVVADEPYFDFKPYDYGPFDRSVYKNTQGT